LGKVSPPCKTAQVPVCGGEVVQFQDYRDNHSIPEKSSNRLLGNYGSRYKDVLKYAQSNNIWSESIGDDSPILRCEILHSVRAEMAVKLSDVVFRRTDLGTANCPSLKQLKIVAMIMADELGWDQEKQADEINEVLHVYSPLSVRKEVA